MTENIDSFQDEVESYLKKENFNIFFTKRKSMDEFISSIFWDIEEDWKDFFSIAKSGKAFLVLDITIDNQNSEGFQVNPNFMKLKDKEGYIYQYSSATLRLDNYFGGTFLDKDEVLSGKVAFEIPKDIK